MINAEGGSSVVMRTGGPPPVARRRRPVSRPLPGVGRKLLGRDEVVDRIGATLENGTPVQLVGARGSGKTVLLREIAVRAVATGRDVVFLTAAGMPVEDVVQELFQYCYDADDYRPEPDRLRRLMGSIQALVVVDDFEGSGEDLRTLLDAMPSCDLLIASSQRCAAEAWVAVEIAGLPHEAALELLTEELRRALRPEEGPSARELLEATMGHPGALIQTAAAIRAAGEVVGTTPAVLAAAVGARLSESARLALGVLSTLPGLGVSAQLLSALAGVAVDDRVLSELFETCLIAPDPLGYKASGELAELVTERAGTRASGAGLAERLVPWVRASSLQAVVDAAPVILRALRMAAAEGRHEAVRDLARAAAPVLGRTLRWGAWHELLTLGRTAAQRLGSAADEAYFAHELGVRRRALAVGAAVGVTVGAAVVVGATLGAAGGEAAAGTGAGKAVTGSKSAIAGKPLVIGGATAAVAAAIVAALALSGGPKPSGSPPGAAPNEAGVSSILEQPITPAPDGSSPSVAVVPNNEPQPHTDSGPPPTRDSFPVGQRSFGKTVHANGYAFKVNSVRAYRDSGTPRLDVDMLVTNELWSVPNPPPWPIVQQGGQAYQGVASQAESYPLGKAVPRRLDVDVEPTFTWDDAVLLFPLFGGRAEPASIPLGGKGKSVELAPRTVTFHKTGLQSGAVRLTMQSGLLRGDAALGADGEDNRNESLDMRGLDPGQAGLRVSFSFEGNPGPSGFHFGTDAFTLKLPNGRVLRPEHGPNVAVYPDSKSYSRLAIATQVDLPATGTYTLTMIDGDGPPDSLTFTVG
ncbi:hypothetical protein JOF56_007467 [Kibdelosporangium banguiense]|uniref:AAA+ ATPase domain-containing protein n=1 Tax=Kibdelosporangium banguiense TaxID=1365924 RepID=A0ABS4TRQ2_9PSEU|nr:hypothetical protein [Kibdelosporangium banguiense]MBP2327082.1 hypothetical protein [Kibdelosporangium banguiense]